MNKKFTNKLLQSLDFQGNPINNESKALLHLSLISSQSQTDKGYKSNIGTGRIVRTKDNSIDYMELSRLYHKGDW